MTAVASSRPRATVIMAAEFWESQFGPRQRDRLRELAELTEPESVEVLTDPALVGRLADLEVLITGWGVCPLTLELLDRMPRLRAVFHCAGSVRSVVSDEVWRRGITVSTSADLNAGPVAEFTLAAIIMAGKKAPFLAADLRRDPADRDFSRRGHLGNAARTVGIVGFSRIGRRVVRLVKQTLYQATCLVFDPYADPEEVASAGGRLVSLEELLPRVDVLSLHAPALPSTRHMIGEGQLAALPDHAVVVNTARGVLIDQAALEAELVSGRLHAILDVTDPEPLSTASVLYRLPNVMITPHISGAMGLETRRLADGALDELERFSLGKPLARLVTHEAFKLSA